MSQSNNEILDVEKIDSLKIDGNQVEPIVISKVMQWEDEFLNHTENHIISLLGLNSLIINDENIRKREIRPTTVKMPIFSKNVVINLEKTHKRPRGKMPIPVPRLIRTPDKEELSFMPHFDSIQGYCKFEETLPDLEDAYSKITLKSYMKKKSKKYIPENLFNDYLLTKFLLEFDNDSKKLRSLSILLGKDEEELQEYLENLQKRIIQMKEMKEKEELRKNTIGIIGMHNKKLFCNICYVYCCNLHMNIDKNGITKKSLEFSEWPKIKTMQSAIGTGKTQIEIKDLMKNKRILFHDDKSDAERYYCFNPTEENKFCYKYDKVCENPVELTNSDLHLLLELLKLEVQNPCLLAYLLGDPKKCYSVNEYLSKNRYLLRNQYSSEVTLSAETIKPLYENQYFYHFIPGSQDITPCNHSGICTLENNCLCSKIRGFCEKHCACKEHCFRQFPGCDCKSGSSCNQRTCKCHANNRECDPDLCACCFRASLQDLKEMTGKQKCLNMDMTLGRQKKTILGNSLICPGFGLFAGEDIQKGDFICEYLGELITREEGERRGLINDITGCTYLFDLTDNSLVDAVNIGSKMRFANHASHGMENSAAKILYVNGISKIGLYAMKNIKAGDEILFNYRIKKKLDWVENYKAHYKLTDKAVSIEIENC